MANPIPAAEASPLSPDTRAVLAAIDGYDTPRITVAQALRALAFLERHGPLTPGVLIRIAEQLDPSPIAEASTARHDAPPAEGEVKA